MKALLFLLTTLVSVGAWAVTDTGTEADHAQLRQLLKIAQEAINEDQPQLLQPYLHKDYVMTMMNQEVVDQAKPLEQLLKAWFKQPGALLKSMHVDPTPTIKTNIYDGRFGVCYGTSVDTYELADGRRFSFDSKWTATVIKEGEQWKLLALHVGVDPIENPLIDGYRSALGLGGVVIEIKRLFE
jgi:hypothetical protein